jgi:hypothetical protein
MVDDLDEEMGERRRSIEEALADLRRITKYTWPPNWPGWSGSLKKRLPIAKGRGSDGSEPFATASVSSPAPRSVANRAGVFFCIES